MTDSLRVFVLCGGRHIQKVNAPGWNPIIAVAVGIDVAAAIHFDTAQDRDRTRQQSGCGALVDLRNQTWRESQSVTLARQCPALEDAQWQQRVGIAFACAQVVRPVAGPGAFQQAPIRPTGC